jgi:uncharacterized YigZ family protein
MADYYKSIEKYSEGIFKEKGSKFLSFAYPVENEGEVNIIRTELKKKYHDARHHVYAFLIGVENPIYRYSDDGEPSNSSGPPVLGQIRSFGLSNILIVVVRYFGGTKLGVPGLINAYKTAAFEALSNANIVLKSIEHKFIIRFQYIDTNAVMNIVKNHKAKILNQDFDNSCSLKLSILKSAYQLLIESLSKIQSIEIENEL